MWHGGHSPAFPQPTGREEPPPAGKPNPSEVPRSPGEPRRRLKERQARSAHHWPEGDRNQQESLDLPTGSLQPQPPTSALGSDPDQCGPTAGKNGLGREMRSESKFTGRQGHGENVPGQLSPAAVATPPTASPLWRKAPGRALAEAWGSGWRRPSGGTSRDSRPDSPQTSTPEHRGGRGPERGGGGAGPQVQRVGLDLPGPPTPQRTAQDPGARLRMDRRRQETLALGHEVPGSGPEAAAPLNQGTCVYVCVR